jgi:L-iditol 2-dehydrogenase
MQTMKALVKYAAGNGNVDILDVPVPPCGAGEVKVEVAYCGLCGTDVHVLHDTFPNYPPVILGHEFAGTVVEKGNRVTNVNLGDRVTVLGASAVTCGECSYCRSGYFIFCSKRRGMGHGVNGAFAQYAVLRPDQLYRIPDSFSLEEASVSEPFAAAVQAVTEVTQVRPGDTALVSGPGPIGLLCLKLLVAEGIRTIVAGAKGDESRLAAAKAFGASEVVDVNVTPLRDAVLQATGGRGVDVAFECAGHGDSVRGSIEALRPMGRYTQVGVCGSDIQFPIDQIFFKQLTMVGSRCYTANTWERMMNIYAQGRLRLNDLITAILPLSDWQNAFNLCIDRKALKVVIYPGESKEQGEDDSANLVQEDAAVPA